MAQDCAINNAHVIEKEIEAAVGKELADRDRALAQCLAALDAVINHYKDPVYTKNPFPDATRVADRIRYLLITAHSTCSK